jgi:hypothetical protein
MSNANDWMRKLQTYAIALKLVCQDLDDDSEEVAGLIEMYLGNSKAFLDNPQCNAFVQQTFMEMEMIRCGDTNEPD